MLIDPVDDRSFHGCCCWWWWNSKPAAAIAADQSTAGVAAAGVKRIERSRMLLLMLLIRNWTWYVVDPDCRYRCFYFAAAVSLLERTDWSTRKSLVVMLPSRCQAWYMPEIGMLQAAIPSQDTTPLSNVITISDEPRNRRCKCLSAISCNAQRTLQTPISDLLPYLKRTIHEDALRLNTRFNWSSIQRTLHGTPRKQNAIRTTPNFGLIIINNFIEVGGG